MTGPDGVGWFSAILDWCHNLSLLFAKGQSWEQLVAAFGMEPRAALVESLHEQLGHPERPTVRVGDIDGWGAYAIAGTVEFYQLEHLQLAGEAFQLMYTDSICPFRYVVDGVFVSGFDMTVPRVRWGDQQRFAGAMAQAGFVDGAIRPQLLAPRFIELAFGITIRQGMVEGPLHSVELTEAESRPGLVTGRPSLVPPAGSILASPPPPS